MFEKKIIFGLLFVLCTTTVQVAYAQPEFSFKFGTIGDENDELDQPTDVVVDKNGNNVYVVDSNNNRINVFEDDGDHDFLYGSFCNTAEIQNCNDNADGADDDGDGQFNNPLAIVTDALGKFYVLDADNERVQVFDDDGEFQIKFGSSDSGDAEYLGSARGLVVQDSTRNILVSNIETDSISVFDSSGNFEFEFDSFDGNDDFTNPSFMTIDNTNEILYVADSGNDRIVIFELVDTTTCPSGTEEVVGGVCFVDEFGENGNDEGKFNDPTGLAFDEANRLLYVSDSDNNRIQIFQIVDENTCPSGTEEIIDGICYLDEFGSSGSANGEFDTPMGIGLDTANDLLFVADSDNDRIQVFELNTEPAVQVPSSPDNLVANPVSPTSIILTWDEPQLAEGVPLITGYKLEYRVGSDDYKIITENSASKSTSFIHEGLDSQETYFYKVYAINSEGTSPSSQIASIKPQHTTAPAALTANAISPNQIRLSWLEPSETFGQTISGYEVKREIIPGVYEPLGNTNSGTTTYIVSGLETGKTYTFAVSATIGYGSTPESNSASATPETDSTDTSEEPITSTEVEITVSTPPIKLTASSVSISQIDLSWSPPVEDGNGDIKGYKIEVKKDSGSFSTLDEDTKSTSTKYSHKNLSKDSKYTYRVSAINSAGVSDPSNEASATAKSSEFKISPIGKLSIDEGKLLSFTVKLTDNTIKNVAFSLDNNPPSGAKITNSGMFTWTPSSSDGGKSHSFDLVAKKDTKSDRLTITISVKDVKTTEPEPTEPKELGLASFVDESKDPQSYVDRYNNEASYKKWFDDNYSEYDSIYQAVGLEDPATEEPEVEEPKVKEKKYGFCGPGTKLIDGVCTIVKKPVVKPWWQFW